MSNTTITRMPNGTIELSNDDMKQPLVIDREELWDVLNALQEIYDETYT